MKDLVLKALALFLWLSSVSAHSAISSDPLFSAAEYYSSKNEYKQAFPLWSELYRKYPDNVSALLKVCELKVMFEGRASCRAQMAAFKASRGAMLSNAEKSLIRERMSNLESLFLTSEGQTAFLQSQPRKKNGDLPGALALLDQAFQKEGGNLPIAREKARAERDLGYYEAYYGTLKFVADLSHYDTDLRPELAEAHLYFKQYPKVLGLYSPSAPPKTARERTAVALALIETGKTDDGEKLLEDLLAQEKAANIPAAAWFVLGKQNGERRYLERVAKTPPPKGWDPFQTSEKIEEARKILASSPTKKTS